MPFNTVALNQMLDGITNFTAPSITPINLVAYASLHTAYSATGTNEVPTSGGSPNYARKSLVWAAAGSGSKATSASVTFDIPPSTTVAFVGLWAVASGGTAATQFAGMGANGGATQFAFTATSASPGSFTVPGSSYSVNDTVVLFPGAGATLPTGVTAGTVYYIGTASGAVVTLSTTLSNANPVNTSSTGAGIMQKIVQESFNAQGTFTLSTDTLTIV